MEDDAEEDGEATSRPDVAARLKRRRVIQNCAVKMTLNKLCRDDELTREIESCVHGVTRTAVEASRFMNYYVLKLLEEGEDVPKIDQSLLYAAFTTMAGSTLASTVEKFGEALQDYEHLRPPDMERFDYRHVPQMLNYAGKDYLTACKNHVVLNISARVGKAFKLFFDALPQDFRAEDRNRARRYFMRRMTREGGPEEEEPMWVSFKRVPTPETRAAVVDYIDRNLERYADLPLDVGGLKPTKRVEKRWWDYLRWLYDLQRFSQEHDARAFSILPLCSFASKHVTIDTGILRGLLLRVSERTGRAKPEALAPFRVAARTHWESYFKLTKAEGNNRRRDFECMLKTDGYAVSVILSKAKAEATGYGVPPPDIDLAGKRVVGLDPGRIDLASCAWLDSDGEHAFSRYSNKEYQQKIGLRKAHVTRRLWMSRADLHEAMTQLPSAKTPSTIAMKAHIAELFLILDRVLALNGLRRARGLRFSQHCLRQRVMYDICERITASAGEDDRPVVVAFGAGMFSSCSRGHAPGPVKGVRRALRERGVEMYDVNEDYTSQLCNCCHSKVVPMYSQGGGMAIHGVRRCISATCMRKTLNRDANAALNILYVFTVEALHGDRPQVFTRRYQSDLARAALVP